MLEVTIQYLYETISILKEKIVVEMALPANKQELSGRDGFLKGKPVIGTWEFQ
jgi:hypothetical protein